MFLSGRRLSGFYRFGRIVGLELLFMMSRREDLPLGAEVSRQLLSLDSFVLMPEVRRSRLRSDR